MNGLDESKLLPQPQPEGLVEYALPTEVGVIPDSPRAKAYRAYLQSGSAPAEIALQLGRPLLEVLEWFTDGGWVKTRKQMQKAVRESSEAAYHDFIAANRVPEALRQLETGRKGMALVDAALDAMKAGTLKDSRGNSIASTSPGQLKILMEAAVSASSIGARVVGLTEKAAADAVAQAQAQTPQKFGLLVIGAGPIGPAPVQVTPIEASGEFKPRG